MKMHLTKGSLMFAIRTPMSIGDFEGEFKGRYSYCIRVSVDQFGPLYLRYGERVRINKKLTNHLFIVTQIDQDPNSKPSVITLLIAETTKEKVDFDLMKGSELILTRAYPSSYRNTNRPEQGQPESKNMSEFKQCKRKGFSEMIPFKDYVGQDMSKVSVSDQDKLLKNEEFEQGYIARNPKNHEDLWYVAKKYFDDNLEFVEEFGDEAERPQLKETTSGSPKIWIAKIKSVEPMTLGVYNEKRGWSQPLNQDREEAGCFITYENDYITWMNKIAFDAMFEEIEQADLDGSDIEL